MFRYVSEIVVAVLLLSLCGCSGYRFVDRPWYQDAREVELGAGSMIKTGERIRLTNQDGVVSEGILVEIDEFAVTYAGTVGVSDLVTVPIGGIRRFEVYRDGAGDKFEKVAIVAGASLIVYGIVQSQSGSTFSPDPSTAN